MMLVMRVLLLCILGLAAAAQLGEPPPGQTAQSPEALKVANVWTSDGLLQMEAVTRPGPPSLPQLLGGSGKETVRPVANSVFVAIDFVLAGEEATVSLVLTDSTGARYTPVAISAHSTEDFHFFVSPEGYATGLTGFTARPLPPGGLPGILLGATVEVTQDKTTRQLTIKVTKPGTKFTAAWQVPRISVQRRSEFALHIGDSKPVPIDTLTSIQETSLVEAATAGDKELVARLLAEGTKVDARDNRGFTPLHAAARRGQKEVAELLLARGAEVNVRAGNGNTPLHEVAFVGRKDVAELLLANGADVNAKANDGLAPLHLAMGNLAMAELLLAKGAQVNAKDNRGKTPLHVLGRKEVAELLLAKGAEVNGKDFEGSTPLHVAARVGRKEMAELLIAGGAEVSLRNQQGQTPLHLAVTGIRHKEVIELLLTKGAEVNAQDKNGLTALHLVVSRGNMAVAELLLARGAEVNVKDNNGRTPLGLAKNNKAMRDLLRKHGAK